MRQSRIILAAAAILAAACSKDSVHYKIPEVVSNVKVTLSAEEIELRRENKYDGVLTVSVENLSGDNLVYSYKMDLEGNYFTSPTDAALIPGGQVSLTAGELNKFLVDHGFNGGNTYADVALRVIGRPADSKVYMKPVVVDSYFRIKGYETTPEDNIEKVYMHGDGCPAGWNLAEPLELERADIKRQVFTYTGLLFPELKFDDGASTYCEGRIKFPLKKNSKTWAMPYLMAAYDDTAVDGDAVTDIIYCGGGSPDNRWKVKKYGKYKVTVDVDNMQCKFELIDDYSDIISRIWMVGDATWAGWENNAPYRIELAHDINHKGIFTWEGMLYPGEFKFPLECAHFEVNTLMPLANGTPISTEEAMRIENVDWNIDKEAHDYKWKVTEETAGKYTITIDVNAMTIKFEKR